MNEEIYQSAASNIVGGPMAPAPDTPVDVVDVQFHTGSKVYYFDPAGIQVAAGDHIIIETARGPEYGICAAGNHQVPFRDIVPPLRKVLRIATEADEKALEANRAKEKRAFEICQQKILDHKLDMQLVSAEYAFDGSKILFFFTADDRVDFRELVKNLASIFRTRIELRQIGVRDKAKMVGGLGICGRPFCCTEFLDDFQPVSIKMAKTQNLSLNPTKISGTCGRLMCCLKYEQEAYEDLLKTSPKLDSFVDTPGGRGTVVDVNLLRQSVRVRMEEQPDTIDTYLNSEIAVLRSGKAKKNDPPIPADLAPISGSGKRPKAAPVPETDEPMHLDPIRFRYRPEDIVEETPEQEELPEPPQAPVQEIPEDEPAPAEPAALKPKKKKENRPAKPAAPKEPAVLSEPAEAADSQGQAPANRRRNRGDRKPKPQQAQPAKEANEAAAPAEAAPAASAEEAGKPEGGNNRSRQHRSRKPHADGQKSAKAPAAQPNAQKNGNENRERKETKAAKEPKEPKEQKAPKEPEASSAESSAPKEAKENKPHRNNYHRRRYHSNKPKGNGGSEG